MHIRQKIYWKSYKTFFNWAQKNLNYSGILITNHLLGLAAIISLIPLNFIHCFYAANQRPRIKYLIEKNRLLSEMYECSKYLDSFSWKVVEEEHFYCTQRIGENASYIVCRVFYNRGNQKFVDYYCIGQHFYYVQDDKLHIMYIQSNR